MEIIFDKMRALFYGWYDVTWGKKNLNLKLTFLIFVIEDNEWPTLGGGAC